MFRAPLNKKTWKLNLGFMIVPKATWIVFGKAFIRRLKPTAINRIWYNEMRDSFPNDCYKNFIIGGKVKGKNIQKISGIASIYTYLSIAVAFRQREWKANTQEASAPYTTSYPLTKISKNVTKATWIVFGKAFVGNK